MCIFEDHFSGKLMMRPLHVELTQCLKNEETSDGRFAC